MLVPGVLRFLCPKLALCLFAFRAIRRNGIKLAPEPIHQRDDDGRHDQIDARSRIIERKHAVEDLLHNFLSQSICKVLNHEQN